MPVNENDDEYSSHKTELGKVVLMEEKVKRSAGNAELVLLTTRILDNGWHVDVLRWGPTRRKRILEVSRQCFHYWKYSISVDLRGSKFSSAVT